jgi:hypothetical protein
MKKGLISLTESETSDELSPDESVRDLDTVVCDRNDSIMLSFLSLTLGFGFGNLAFGNYSFGVRSAALGKNTIGERSIHFSQITLSFI